MSEWGRRDLNPRSTDISGVASVLQRVVTAAGDHPAARYISLERRPGRWPLESVAIPGLATTPRAGVG